MRDLMPPPAPPLPVPPLLYPPVAFYFRVSFGTAATDADCSFSEVSGIAAEMETETVVEGGENRFLYTRPKAAKHSNLVLKRGVAPCTSRLVTWCRDVLEGGLGQPITTQLIRVALMDESGQALRLWTFDGAYPVKWEVNPFQSSKNEVAIEKMEFSYLNFKRAK
jgi:phage tail-like protein